MDAIEQAKQAGVTLDDHQAISEDLPCVGCGYLLRSLKPSGDCPECGRAVSDTTRVQRLKNYPMIWLKQMRLGLRLMQITCVLFAMAVLIFAINIQQNMRMTSSMTLTAVDILFVAVLFPGAAGFWLLTQPYQSKEKLTTARRIARFMTVSSVVGFVFCLVIPPITEKIGLFETMSLLTAWFAIGAFAMLWHASSIASMIPHRRMSNLSRRLSMLTFLFLIVCASYSSFLSSSLNTIKAPIGLRLMLYNVGPMIGAIVLMLICGVYLLILHWYRKRFSEAIKQVTGE